MDGWVGGWMHLQSHQDEAVLDAVSILKRPLRADLCGVRLQPTWTRPPLRFAREKKRERI